MDWREEGGGEGSLFVFVGLAKRREEGGRTDLESSLATNGDEDDALLALGLCGVDGEVGASHDAYDDFAILHQAEADGVLSPSEESLGSINRVERPVTCTIAS